MKSMLALVLCLGAATLHAQDTAILRGEVIDPSGAVVPQARITLTGPQRLERTAAASELGAYSFESLPPGRYRVRITAAGFAPFEIRNLPLEAGRALTLKSQLSIATETQTITVEDYNRVSVDPSATASAIVLRGADLDVLSDNPDDLAADLQALAGPSAGPNGGEIFVDGFSGGQLPPKASIREVRINQNPFSAEYDRLGFGRIEIFTRPGADTLRGQGFFNFSDESMNSRNPFSPVRAPFQMRQYGFNLGGPLSKKASWFFDLDRRDIDENAVVNATTLDADLNPTPFSQAIVTPQRRISFNPRFDYQLSTNHTLVVRYMHSRSESEGQGIGEFTLPSRATSSVGRDHILQITETAILAPTVINETRFQYMRNRSSQLGDNSIPALNVLEAFNSGGAAIGESASRNSRYEWHNLTSIARNTHMYKFGGRVRYGRTSDYTDAGFNGAYTFAGGLYPSLINSLERYRITLLGLAQGLSAAEIRARGGGASQFTLTAGSPLARIDQTDLGLFFEDSWRLRPNFTLNYGLRYETQTNISDYTNLAPRLSIAWGLDGGGGRAAKTVLRAGFGVFYDRINDSLVLQTRRFDGVTQQQYFVSNPDFYPLIPSVDELAAYLVDPTQRRLAADIRAPYIAQSVIGVDRQLPRNTTLSVNYIFSRGERMLRARNINAPLADLTRPLGDIGNVYLYETTGLLRQNQLMLNMNTRFSSRVTLFGFYVYGRANSDTDGAGSFPADQYGLSSEYGRASYDIRHRFTVGGSVSAPWGVSLNPFVMLSSGGPFNITTGRDNNGDTLFNDRPSFATDLTSPNVVVTRFGAFNLTPLPGETIIPRNYGAGPAQFTVNLRLGRTWGFGGSRGEQTAAAGMPAPPPGGPGGGPGRGGPGGGPGMGPGGGGGRGPGGMFGQTTSRRYNLTLSLSARNLLNHTNLGSPIGNLSSALFGESNSLGGMMGPGGGRDMGFGGNTGAGNRRLEVQLRFSF